MSRHRLWTRAGLLTVLSAMTGLAGLSAAAPARAAPSAVLAYAPSVLLYSSDSYRPASADGFLTGSTLRWAHDQSCADHQIAARGNVDTVRLGDGGYQHQTASGWPWCNDQGQQYRSTDFTRPRDGEVGGEGFFLDLDNAQRRGLGTSSPVYYEYVAQRFVTYWFFYSFNNAITSVADHEGDWERISIRLDALDRAITVAYYAHSGYCTVPWNAVATHQAHPVAYSATGTHASFPTAGQHGLDTTDAGPRWNTWNRLLNVRDQAWYGYGGAWGEVGETVETTGPLGPSGYKSPAPTDWNRPC